MHPQELISTIRGLCTNNPVFGRWGERPNERVITVGIGWVLLASATSGFSGYIKLAYCSSAKGLQ